jgi:hypothetical protein
MTKEKYDAEWQTIIKEFISQLAEDPWVQGRVAVAAKHTMRKIAALDDKIDVT